MQSALQPYATTGVAIVGASLIAVTPVAAPLPAIATVRDVALTSGGSTAPDLSPLGTLLAPWIDQYNTAAQNATVLANNFFLAPFVGLQQLLANHNDFTGQVLADPTTIPDVVNQIQQNVAAVSDAFTLIGNGAPGGLGPGGDPVTTEVFAHTLSGGIQLNPTGVSEIGHFVLASLLPGFLPSSIPPEVGQALINFLGSPLSGIMMGFLGPLLSPGVALLNSIEAIGNDLGTDPSTALNDLMALPANVIGSFFNGADLNLDALVPVINSSGVLPAGTEIFTLDLALGGLLTPGTVASAPYEVLGDGGQTIAEVAAPGGSILNSLGLTINAGLAGISLIAHAESEPVGPIGALEAWSQIVGILRGSGWSGKNDPQPALPPLTNFSFPHIPSDFFGDDSSGSAAAGDLSDALGQLLGGGDSLSDFF